MGTKKSQEWFYFLRTFISQEILGGIQTEET